MAIEIFEMLKGGLKTFGCRIIEVIRLFEDGGRRRVQCHGDVGMGFQPIKDLLALLIAVEEPVHRRCLVPAAIADKKRVFPITLRDDAIWKLVHRLSR